MLNCDVSLGRFVKKLLWWTYRGSYFGAATLADKAVGYSDMKLVEKSPSKSGGTSFYFRGSENTERNLSISYAKICAPLSLTQA